MIEMATTTEKHPRNSLLKKYLTILQLLVSLIDGRSRDGLPCSAFYAFFRSSHQQIIVLEAQACTDQNSNLAFRCVQTLITRHGPGFAKTTMTSLLSASESMLPGLLPQTHSIGQKAISVWQEPFQIALRIIIIRTNDTQTAHIFIDLRTVVYVI